MHLPHDPLRIVMLNHNRMGTGSFYRCWHLGRGLSRLGYQVRIVTVSPSHRIRSAVSRDDGLTVVETPNLMDLWYGIGSGFGVVGIPSRILAMARGQFDVIHAFDHKPNVLLPAMLGRVLRGAPLVADWADWWGFTCDGSGLQERRRWPVAQLENASEEFAHRRADAVTTISTGLQERARALGIPPDRVTWIPSGAPDDLIRREDPRECRRALGLPEDLYLLGYVGSEMGDIDLLVPFVHRLRTKHPRVRLALIGPKHRSRRLAYAEARGDAINFGGVPFSALSTHLGACDVLVLPLRDTVFNRTRWPNKFGDYIAAGRPVLCSPVGDVAKVVVEERCGILWDDFQELHDAVSRLLGDERASEEMGLRARELAEGRLSWHTLVPRFLAVYYGLAGPV